MTKNHPFRLLLAAALGLSLAQPVQAQNSGGMALCGGGGSVSRQDIESDVLPGRWIAALGPGYAITNGRVVPHPADNTPHFARIEKDGGGAFTLIPEAADGVTLDLEWAGGKTWRFDRRPDLPEGTGVQPGTELPDRPYDSETLGLGTDCPVEGLPRYLGRGTATIEGMTMNFTYWLMLVTPEQLAGFQQVNGTAQGIAFLERRPVSMRKMSGTP